MPSILLINDNKIVSRLLQLSSKKHEYNLEEVTTLDTSGDSYDVVFIDSDLYSEDLLKQIKSKLNFNQLGYIGSKKDATPDGFELAIEKPFLPTDFVELIKKQVIERSPQTVVNIDEDIDDLNLDDEKELLLDENLNLEDMGEEVSKLLVKSEKPEENLSDDLEVEDELDLSLASSAVMSTGIAASMMQSENDSEELVDMASQIDEVSQIDDQKMDSFDLPEELPAEENILAEILSPTEEVLDNSLPLSESKDELSSDLNVDSLAEDEQMPQVEEALAAAVEETDGATASPVVDTKDDLLEDVKEEVLASSDSDIESLKEEDIKVALGEQTDEVVEEIISQEIVSEGEETVVESNDIQEWIREAVAKAITPEMIKEALAGMDVDMSLSFNSKKEDSTIL